MIAHAVLAHALLEPSEAASVELRWTAPSECPGVDEVRGNVEALVGTAIVQGDAIVVDGVVTHSDQGWSLDLSITSASGSRTRTLPGASCRELARVAALLIAVAIDPSMQDEPEPAPPTPAPAPVPIVAPTPVEPRSAPPRRRALAGAFGVHGVLGYGALPRVAGALGPHAALLVGAARIELAASFWFPSETRSDRGAIRMWHIDARGCWSPMLAKHVELPLCGGLQAGAMVGHGDAIARPTNGRLPWVAIDAGLGVIVLPVDRVGLRLDVRGVAPLVRPGFAVDDDVVFRARALAIAATLGVEVRLGRAAARTGHGFRARMPICRRG
ncbi:MAG TPA: hypothetical protein VG755_33040 [Nannocystaceae bacterium]|nr:hypothetical protein [Nannocystaceae bacterium]